MSDARQRGSRGAERADLNFGTSTDRAGFTPAGIAAFSDLRPAAVVRELIQNSLDAALIDAQEPCAQVRFELGTCMLNEIPGVDSYRRTFQKACEEHPHTGGGARPVVERIKRTLKQKSPHKVLTVTDNGVGLDGRRMSALLSDGVSAKGGYAAAGTFGNGHSVVIPTSDLRYVLYGGLTAAEQTYGAGQAVLASHWDDRESRSGRGLYLKSFQRQSADVPFTLAQGDDIPPMIASAIQRVRDGHGHGTAVIIPAFNNFGGEQSLREAVFKAAAFNFFQAIHDGLLRVEVEEPEGADMLDANNLRNVLREYRDEKRSSQGALLSGRKAYEAYEAIVDGDSHEIETAQGNVTVRLLEKETARRRVGLCRNGMWITEDLPTFQGAFADRQPFQALILLNSDRDTDFFKLIQEAETPLHDKLALKQMEPDRRKKLRNALSEVREGIKERVSATTEDVYHLQDIFAFQFDEVEEQGSGGRQPAYWGRVGPTRREPMGSGGPGGGGGGNGRRRNPRVVVEPIFRIASVPAGAGRRTVHVECAEDFEDAELRMFVDENVDATCDRQTRAQAASLLLSNVVVNGRALKASELVGSDHFARGAKLGSLAADTRIVVETDYEVPAGVRVQNGQEPAIRIEILSSRKVAPKKVGQPGDAQIA